MTDTVLLAGQVAMAITALGALLAGAWWLVRRIVHIADAVDQLLPNGGASLKDQVTRIETQLAEHIEQHQQGVA